MAVTFNLRDQLSGDWDSAKGALIDQLDLLFAGLGPIQDLLSSAATPLSSLITDATGALTLAPNGTWTREPLNATTFLVAGGATGTWVVAPAAGTNLAPLSYMIHGSTMFLSIDILNSALTTTGGRAVTLTVPGGYNVPNRQPIGGSFLDHTFNGSAYMLNNTSEPAARLEVIPGTNLIYVYRVGSDYVTSTDFSVRGQLCFEITPR